MARTEKDSLKEVFNSILKPSPLTVGDARRFTEQGGIIRLFFKERKLRFEISGERAREAEIKVSAKLLLLAEPMTRRSAETSEPRAP